MSDQPLTPAKETYVNAPHPQNEDVAAQVEAWIRAELDPQWVVAHDGGVAEELRRRRRDWGFEGWTEELSEHGLVRPEDVTSPADVPPIQAWGWALGRARLCAPGWPREYGGRGYDAKEVDAANQVLDEYAVPGPYDFVGLNIVGPALLQWGTDDQKAGFLPGIAEARDLWCQLFSEPDAGSDLAALRTTAEADPGGWRIRGSKIWTSLGHLANYGILLARTGSQEDRHRSLTCYLLPMTKLGVGAKPIETISRTTHFSEVFLDDVIIPDALRLGPVNGGWRVALSILSQERASLGNARVVGRERPTVQDLMGLAGLQDGGSHESMQYEKLVELRVREVLVALSAARIDAPRYAQLRDPSVAKLLKAQLSQNMAEEAMEIIGWHGIAWQGSKAPFQLTELLESRADTIAGGTTEIQKNILAERVLGLPK